MPTNVPITSPYVVDRDNAANVAAAAVVVIVVWAVKQFGKVDIPPEVAAAITGVVSFIVIQMVPSIAASAPTPSSSATPPRP